MEPKYYRTWHLAKNDTEFRITEYEYAVVRFYEAFVRWVTSAGAVVADADIKFSEHLILHVIRMQDRPKNSSTIARLINRDDIPNVQYSLRKLEAANLIKKSYEKGSKTPNYTMTPLGEKVTDEYARLRSEILVSSIKSIGNIDERITDTTQLLSVMTGIYEEMARSSATFNQDE